MELDNLSYLSLKNQVTDFPVHYHETYCISYIHKGIEQLDIAEQTHYGEAGSVTVTHPFEVHSQPVTDVQSPPGFDTIYLSDDLMRYYTGCAGTFHLQRKIDDPITAQSLLKLRNALQQKEEVETSLENFIRSLMPYESAEKLRALQESHLPWLEEVKGFIEHNISSKINLDELASIANINKYGFSKTFKNSTGMSPINYVLMQKVFLAKKQIKSECNLTLLAYEFDFTDLAHFSKTFKRFVGISPQAYKSNLK